MKSRLDIEIRDRLASYIVGEISLKDFEDWFVPVSWNIIHSGNLSAINLAYEVELWLAEFSDGYWSEDELKEHFKPLVMNYIVYDSHVILKTGVANVNLKNLPSEPVDIQYGGESL